MLKDEGRTAILRRLARLLLYAMTCRRKPPIDVLAARLGVSTRTVYRDLEAFAAVGWQWPDPEALTRDHAQSAASAGSTAMSAVARAMNASSSRGDRR